MRNREYSTREIDRLLSNRKSVLANKRAVLAEKQSEYEKEIIEILIDEGYDEREAIQMVKMVRLNITVIFFPMSFMTG